MGAEDDQWKSEWEVPKDVLWRNEKGLEAAHPGEPQQAERSGLESLSSQQAKQERQARMSGQKSETGLNREEI